MTHKGLCSASLYFSRTVTKTKLWWHRIKTPHHGLTPRPVTHMHYWFSKAPLNTFLGSCCHYFLYRKATVVHYTVSVVVLHCIKVLCIMIYCQHTWNPFECILAVYLGIADSKWNIDCYLGWEDPLEKGMAAHSGILAWRIPWTDEAGRLPSMKEADKTEQLTYKTVLKINFGSFQKWSQ